MKSTLPVLTRRSFLKKSIVGTTATVLPLAGVSCSGTQSVLRIGNWADLIGATTIRDFERKYRCRVSYETYSSNEDLHAKLNRLNQPYDVVVPSDYMVHIMSSEGLLMEHGIDRSDYESVLMPSLLGHEYDQDNRYSLPYVYWGTGLAVNTSKYNFQANNVSWNMLMNDELLGWITVLDEMRYTLGMALLNIGASVNSTSEEELKQAEEWLIELKPHLLGFITDIKDLLIHGEPALSYAYSGDVFQASRENPSIEFHVPETGGIIGIDNLCITRDCRVPDLAGEFIRFLLDPEVAGNITNHTYYATANQRALEEDYLRSEIAANSSIFIDIQQREKLHVLHDLGDVNDIYYAIWDRVKRA